MDKCSIEILLPNKIIKGAGFLDSTFLPSWIYKVKLSIINNTDSYQLSSLNVVLPNGIRFLENLNIDGPDKHILDIIKVVSPNKNVGNDNVIIFANNFKISGMSENIISFDIALCDKFTKDSLENSGEKIPHKHKLNFCANLLSDFQVYSNKNTSEALEYDVNINSEVDKATPNDTVKFYIECKTGQYDMVKNVYFRNILDDCLIYLDGTSNIEPNQIYPFDNDTVLKWEFGSLKPCETRKIGYKAKLNKKYKTGSEVKAGDIITNYVNSNCTNNSTYTQCPSKDFTNLYIVK